MVQCNLFEGFCLCGAPESKAGMCMRCYGRAQHDRRRFGGNRERVLRRDGWQCRGCGGRELLIVHHRAPSNNAASRLITLCAFCHPRVHLLGSIRYWMPAELVALWEEQHPGSPVQLQLVA